MNIGCRINFCWNDATSILFVSSLFLLFAASGISPAQINSTKILCNDREEILWMGAVSEDWEEPLNWNTSLVPDQTANVIMPASPSGGDYPLVRASVTAECQSLRIESGSLLRIRGFLTAHTN